MSKGAWAKTWSRYTTSKGLQTHMKTINDEKLKDEWEKVLKQVQNWENNYDTSNKAGNMYFTKVQFQVRCAKWFQKYGKKEDNTNTDSIMVEANGEILPDVNVNEDTNQLIHIMPQVNNDEILPPRNESMQEEEEETEENNFDPGQVQEEDAYIQAYQSLNRFLQTQNEPMENLGEAIDYSQDPEIRFSKWVSKNETQLKAETGLDKFVIMGCLRPHFEKDEFKSILRDWSRKSLFIDNPANLWRVSVSAFFKNKFDLPVNDHCSICGADQANVGMIACECDETHYLCSSHTIPQQGCIMQSRNRNA